MNLANIATSIDEHKRNRAAVSDLGHEGLMQALYWWNAQTDQTRIDLTGQFQLGSSEAIHDFYWQNPCQTGVS